VAWLAFLSALSFANGPSQTLLPLASAKSNTGRSGLATEAAVSAYKQYLALDKSQAPSRTATMFVLSTAQHELLSSPSLG